MATLTSKLIVELLDRATGPAGRIAATINKMQAASRANSARLEEMRGRLIGAAGAGFALYKGISAPTRAAIDFESAMADIRKVVNFETPEAFKQMGLDIRAMSLRMPMAAKGIAEIVAAAGQSGIANSNLLKFAEITAKVGVAWDTSAKETGQALAELKAGLGLSLDETASLADAINHLGNNSAASAPKILDVVQRVAASAKQFGMSAEQTAAFGAAMVGAGFDSNVAATSILNMGRALVKGASATKRQTSAYKTLGLTPLRVAKAMQKDAPKTIQAVLERINKVPAHMRGSLISDLFGDEARALGPLITNGKLLADVLALIGDKTKYAGSAQQEYDVRSKTTANNLQLFQNRAYDLAISIGDALAPGLNRLLDVLGPMVTSFSDLAKRFPHATSTAVALTAGLIGLQIAAIGAQFALLWMKGGALLAGIASMKALGAATKVASITMWPMTAGARALGRAVGIGAVSSRSAAKATAAQAAATLTQRQAAFQSALAMQAMARQGKVAGLNAAGAAANVRRAGMALAAAQVDMKAANAGLAATGIGARAAASAFNVLKFAVIGTGIGAAIAVAAAAGTWIYNNWSGIKEMFAGIGEGFKRAFGWEGVSIVRGIADGIGSIVSWFGQLLGPLDQTDKGWRSWGEAVGEIAGGGVKKIVSAFGWLIDKLEAAWDLAKKLGSVLGFGGGSETPSPAAATTSSAAPAKSGTRAAGGPVQRGLTYLVGERGPELFTPPTGGNITNALETVRAIKAQALANAAKAGGGAVTNVGGITIHIQASAGQSPEAVAAAVERRLSEKLSALSRGAYSDGVY